MVKMAFSTGGFIRKNLFVEENAGIRENSYKTWYRYFSFQGSHG
jgi:hypothetical protein